MGQVGKVRLLGVNQVRKQRAGSRITKMEIRQPKALQTLHMEMLTQHLRCILIHEIIIGQCRNGQMKPLSQVLFLQTAHAEYIIHQKLGRIVSADLI